MGFNPAWSRRQRRPITPHVESFRGRTVRTVRIGSFTTLAVEDGPEVAIEDVQTPVSNWCFGVSMLGR